MAASRSGEAEPLIRIIDSYAAARRRGLERLDPHTGHITPAMNRADALLAMVAHHCQESLAPNHGGDRPRIVVTVSYDQLAKAARDAGPVSGHLVGTAEPVPAALLHQWLCDADLMPAVPACDHHHPIVEPGHDPTADRWQVQIRDDGTPHVIPPKKESTATSEPAWPDSSHPHPAERSARTIPDTPPTPRLSRAG